MDYNQIILLRLIIMLSKKGENERFAKVIMKLNSTQDKPETTRPPSSQNSFTQDLSSKTDKSTRYGSQIQGKSTATNNPIDQSKALRILLDDPEVLINRQVMRLKMQCIPTSNGMRLILVIGQTLINLSWVHSVQQLQPGKILVLYYDLRSLNERKAKMQSLIVQVGRTQGYNLLNALVFLHKKHHDDEIQKLYHYLC